MLRASDTFPSKIIHEYPDVEYRLKELDPGLDQDIFMEANMRGYEARLEATPAHAPTAAGTFHWHAFVPALRTALIVRNWTKKDHKNCPLIVSPDRHMMILVMTGNSETGKIYGNPSNQGSKGSVLDEGIYRNQQYELFENKAISTLNRGLAGTQLWVLLYHVETGIEGDKEIRSELSLPSSFNNRKISAWSERIIMQSINLGPEFTIQAPIPTPPIDIPIERIA